MDKFEVIILIGNQVAKAEFEQDSALHNDMVNNRKKITGLDGLYFFKEPLSDTPMWFRLENEVPFVNKEDIQLIVDTINEEAKKEEERKEAQV